MGSMENIFAVNIDKNNKINKSKYVKEGDCIFPFKYKRKDVNECLDSERGKWCATSLKDNGTYETYAYCPETEKQKEISEFSKKSIKKKKKSKKKVLHSLLQVSMKEKSLC